jgi:hypothetical protein
LEKKGFFLKTYCCPRHEGWEKSQTKDDFKVSNLGEVIEKVRSPIKGREIRK